MYVWFQPDKLSRRTRHGIIMKFSLLCFVGYTPALGLFAVVRPFQFSRATVHD